MFSADILVIFVADFTAWLARRSIYIDISRASDVIARYCHRLLSSPPPSGFRDVIYIEIIFADANAINIPCSTAGATASATTSTNFTSQRSCRRQKAAARSATHVYDIQFMASIGTAITLSSSSPQPNASLAYSLRTRHRRSNAI